MALPIFTNVVLMTAMKIFTQTSNDTLTRVLPYRTVTRVVDMCAKAGNRELKRLCDYNCETKQMQREVQEAGMGRWLAFTEMCKSPANNVVDN